MRVNYILFYLFIGFCEGKCLRRSKFLVLYLSIPHLFPYTVLIWQIELRIASDSTSHIRTCSSRTKNTPVCIAGKCRLHIFSPSQKHAINNIQSYIFLFFPLSFAALKYASKQHDTLASPCFRRESSANYSLDLLPSISSAGNNTAYTSSQPGQVTALHSHHLNLTATIHRGPPLRLRSGISLLLDG